MFVNVPKSLLKVGKYWKWPILKLSGAQKGGGALL